MEKQQGSEPRGVGRPRTFDLEAALDAAMQIFWEHGYEAASLAVLREAMGLTAPQIYNCFGDKETLFRLALARYAAMEAQFAGEALSSPGTARQSIEQLLKGAAAAYTKAGRPGGCLFVTGAMAASDAAKAIADELKRCRKESESAILERLQKGIEAGDLPVETNCVALAKYFTGAIHGMSIQARDGATQAELLRLAEIAMKAWPGAPGTRRENKADTP